MAYTVQMKGFIFPQSYQSGGGVLYQGFYDIDIMRKDSVLYMHKGYLDKFHLGISDCLQCFSISGIKVVSDTQSISVRSRVVLDVNVSFDNEIAKFNVVVNRDDNVAGVLTVSKVIKIVLFCYSYDSLCIR